MEEYFERICDIQKRVALLAEITPLNRKIKTIVGIDVSYMKDTAFGCLVKWNSASGKVEELVKGKFRVKFPYISTLLMFREGPVILQLYRESNKDGDVYLVNGHGLLHPRGSGLATFFGVITGKPTIGVAKRLIKDMKVEIQEGIVYLERKAVGIVYKPRKAMRHLYASIGNKVTIGDIRNVLKICDKGSRLPEPLRLAHIESRRMLKDEGL